MKTLSTEQLAAVTSTAPQLILKAGAGSGKTTVLTHRIAHLIAAGADPAKCVAVSFTVTAGRELAERLAGLGVAGLRHVGTIHSLALSESHKWPTWGYKRPTVIDEDAQADLIRAELDRLRLGKTVTAKLVAAHLACGAASKPALPGSIGIKAETVARSVRRTMIATGVASMDLLLGEAVAYLPGSLGELDALFWDEYQDTAMGDFAIMTGIRAKSKTVVGDLMQSIFGFSGSSPDYFKHLLFSAEWEKLTLADNYRSLPAIVDAANKLTSGHVGAIAMQKVRDYPNLNNKSSVADLAVLIYNASTEVGEFDHIRTWLSLYGGKSTAILCRHNALADRIRLALADALPPAPAFVFDPVLLRRAMKAIQNPGETWHEHHDALPYVRHFTDLYGTDNPDVLPPAMAEALSQAQGEEGQGQEYGGLYIGSVHSAKGREWDHVLIAGAEAKAWPDTEEMLRLFYVAVTRARDTLTITCAKNRPSLHSRGMTESQPCKFIDLL